MCSTLGQQIHLLSLYPNFESLAGVWRAGELWEAATFTVHQVEEPAPREQRCFTTAMDAARAVDAYRCTLPWLLLHHQHLRELMEVLGQAETRSENLQLQPAYGGTESLSGSQSCCCVTGGSSTWCESCIPVHARIHKLAWLHCCTAHDVVCHEPRGNTPSLLGSALGYSSLSCAKARKSGIQDGSAPDRVRNSGGSSEQEWASCTSRAACQVSTLPLLLGQPARAQVLPKSKCAIDDHVRLMHGSKHACQALCALCCTS